MKTKFIQIMSILLAGMLQIAPLLRSFLPSTQGLAPSAWGIILKISVGATALMGFDAVSQASSISISPPNATVGQPYIGTVTYSGGHSGSVRAMSLTNNCLATPVPFLDGLTIVYSGGNVALVSGTPTNAATYSFAIKVYDSSTCGSGNSDNRATTLVVGASGGGTIAPTIASIANTVAQVGSDVQLSGAATGNPIPQYQWWSGATPITGATNSVFTIHNVQLTNAGAYTLTASNTANAGNSFIQLPKASCILSVCISGGTNFTTFNYTNYAPAGVALTMYSTVTNLSNATNYYQWIYNQSPTPVLSTSNTLPLSGNILTPAKSGTYTVSLNSTNSGGSIISGQNYDSYWAFGYLPRFTNSMPAATNVNAGSSVTFSLAVGGSLNVYNSDGPGTYTTNNVDPCVFWYQGPTLVASQNYVCGPTTGTIYSNSVVNAILMLNNLTSANSGSYTVVVTNYWGSLTSSPVVLSVSGGSTTYPPVITTNPPASLSLLVGQSSAISITVTGTPPYFFQWRLGGTNLANGGVYGGALTNTLALTGVTTNNSGNYTVAITNSSGSVTSSVASVSIAQPPTVSAGSGSSGMVSLSANTVAGLIYIVEMTTNLASLTWTSIQTNTTGLNGAINFQTNTVGGRSIFYRFLFP